MVQVNNSSVTAFRRVRSQELRTPGSAKHEKTRAELAAPVHKSAAAAPLPDERARHRPRRAASRPGKRGRGGIPAGAGPSPLPPPRYATAAPPQGHVTGSQRRHVGRGGKRRPSVTASLFAHGAGGAAVRSRHGGAVPSRAPTLEPRKQKEGSPPFPRAKMVLAGWGTVSTLAPPPAGPSALAAPV